MCSDVRLVVGPDEQAGGWASLMYRLVVGDAGSHSDGL